VTSPAGAARVVVGALGRPPVADIAAASGSPGAVSLWAAPPGRPPVCGWQSGSLLAQLAPATLLARGATVQLPSPLVTRRDGRRTSQALVRAATAVAGRPACTTWLPAMVDLVLVIVDAAGSPGSPGGLPEVSLDGTAAGEPTVIAAGRRLYLLYPVTGREPGRPLISVWVDGSGERLATIPDPDWQLAGVLGLPGSLDSWALVLAHGTPRHLVPDWPLSPDGPVTIRHQIPPASASPATRGESS
jgi:hypothetical protein